MGRPKAESPLSQEPRPVFVKTLYTLSVCAQIHLPKFLETSLDNREDNGNPLQYSCLGNPMDRGAWWATVHGVTKELDTT